VKQAIARATPSMPPAASPVALPARSAARQTARELALALVVIAGYFLTRGLIHGRADTAELNAQDLIALERTLHVGIEASLQAVALRHSWLTDAANLFYVAAHLPVLVAVAVWLYLKHPAAYRRYRDAFLISALLGLCVYVALPVAPPRFMPGFVDTLKASGLDLDGSDVRLLYNPYAAMPSLHVGWALLAGYAMLRTAHAWWLRLAGAALPPLMIATVLITGNHWVLDAAAGALIATLALVCSWRWRAWRESAATLPVATSAEAAVPQPEMAPPLPVGRRGEG
jgi:membrane-associated phospholipid phosphatase